MCTNHVLAWCPGKSGEGTGSSKSGVTNARGPPWGSWETNMGPLQEQVVFTTKLSLQLHLMIRTPLQALNLPELKLVLKEMEPWPTFLQVNLCVLVGDSLVQC